MNTDSNILKILAKELYIIHIPNIPIAQNWFRIPKSFNVIYHIHKLKKIIIITCTIISKMQIFFEKTKRPFMIKTISKLEIEGNVFNSVFKIYPKTPKLKLFLMRNKLFFNWDQKLGKDVHPYHSYSILYSSSS